ncbi:response regulator [Alginatibacterium sediminis]|uniref:histidine kinase n=1 Tax=Alginatibacterium sediminis TaxID=2164068 RepID=A0A420E6X8_9ALTE|nr:ATP-binding protein [Alginatibacterium sediminis]RKF14256.1 response regulator [Alginatibacterium sediminis]
MNRFAVAGGKSGYMKKSLRLKLMAAFLLLSILPLCIITAIFLNSYQKDLRDQIELRIQSVGDLSQQQIIEYFDKLGQETSLFAQGELAKASIGRFYGFSAAFLKLANSEQQARTVAQSRYIPGSQTTLNKSTRKFDPSRDDILVGEHFYDRVHMRYHREYSKLAEQKDISDIYLIDTKGNVVYSVNKYSYFGSNLLTGFARDSGLGRNFAALYPKLNQNFDSGELVQFTDFSLNTSTGEYVAYIGVPIKQHSYIRGVVIVEVNSNELSRMLQKQDDQKLSQEILLFGKDRRLRADITSQENVHWQFFSHPAGYDADLLQSIQMQSAGVTSASLLNKDRLLAFREIFVFDNPWTLLVSVEENLAYAGIKAFKTKVIWAVLLASIVFVLFARWLSLTITAPLLRLSRSAEQVAAGDLNEPIEAARKDGDEIQRLAASFADMQNSVREKIRQISDKNQQLQALDRFKDELIANTSHELRTPIHGIIGMANALMTNAEQNLSPTQLEQVQLLAHSGERLSRLVDDLLDYHQMRYGKTQLDIHAVDINAVVAFVIRMNMHSLGGKPLEIVNHLSLDLPLVNADEGRLEQVLFNLLANAIKYTSQGKIVFSASVDLSEQCLLLKISDTGSGIADEHQKRIFEPLVQLDGSREISGYGLGLSIVAQLMRLMGGDIQLESELEVGSQFMLRFPLSNESEVQIRNTKHHQLRSQIPEISWTAQLDNSVYSEHDINEIWAVDDETLNLRIIENLLLEQNIRVRCFSDAHQVLERLENSSVPSLLIADVMMPQISGLELCQRIRVSFDQLELPILMLTALGQSENVVAGFEAGANDYLVKPLVKEELLARVHSLILARELSHTRSQNNLLEDELRQHIHSQQQLEQTQDQLLGILENIPEIIIGTSADGLIVLFNRAAELEFEIEASLILQQPLSRLLILNDDPKVSTLVLRRTMETRDFETFACNFDSGLGQVYLLASDTQFNQQRWQLIEDLIESLPVTAGPGSEQLYKKIRALGGNFVSLSERLDPKQDTQSLKRQLIVELMQLSLSIWINQVGESKLSLAEKSGLWRVYIDRSSPQTRTLDKYFNTETLPKTPRWRIVIQTADFILQRCPDDESHEQLRQIREKLAQSYFDQ